MFRVEKNVPEVYINESRDFQLFSRLYDLVFQSARFSIDSMESATDTLRCNENLLPLIGTKVGFFKTIDLTDNSYRKVLSAFPYIINYKGSLQGIRLTANVFEHIMNTTVDVEQYEQNRVTVAFESQTPNVELLYALLEYIRPTGLTIDYVVRTTIESYSDYSTSDKVTIKQVIDHGFITNDVSELDSNIGFTQINNNL